VPEQAFADGLRVNRARGGAPLARNTPTVITAACNSASFSDLRTTYLEDRSPTSWERRRDARQLGAIARALGRDPALAAALPHGLR
jgi:hypothetical protein